ncbi:RNA polymerase sigma factor [Umezawaea tangerina]|uniref:RNA polymerase sigma-70 factor (ECF subfamily) n=1 Tax=Umezawaea tangerina TaxID=84725 RepID=A0A2T0TCQ5_9PSEU|nr:RNA polymerase sigma factor [Umezawaea tangerina]PRY43439.1 RNA polymerase sigma-70 factor (ECF subfamily) [Umezawaea tangerina]
MVLSVGVSTAGSRDPEPRRRRTIAEYDRRTEREYEKFDRAERAALLAYLLYQGFAQHIAEESVNDAMLEVYANWLDVKSPRAWIRTVARRVAVRKAKADRRSLLDRFKYHRPPDVLAEDVVLSRILDLDSDLVDAIRRLPVQCRSVFILHVDDFSVREIAEVEGIPERTAYERLRVARKMLRAWVEESLKNEEGK